MTQLACSYCDDSTVNRSIGTAYLYVHPCTGGSFLVIACFKATLGGVGLILFRLLFYKAEM